MKNLLKKLHIMPNQPTTDDSEGSTSSKRTNRLSDVSSSESHLQSHSQSLSHHNPENKAFSAISGWLNSVTNRRSPSPPSSSDLKPSLRLEVSDSVSSAALDAALDAVKRNSGSSNSRDPDIEEEYQLQLALELSAREDPEAVQIEAVKQISLGSSAMENTPAEVIAYRYWNYNALSYDDKIVDGFYDLYGILMGPTSSNMPSLVNLQGTPVTENITWEAVLVNKAADAKLLRLEQKALEIVVKSKSEYINFLGNDLVKKLAVLVSEHMGGPVGDPERMLLAWRGFSSKLKSTLGSMVLPLGALKVGLARHRALLFKVLADSVGMPCRLVKGQQYTGSSDVAMNFVKIGDGREYIVDLMADPGTLIPSDTAPSHQDYEESLFSSGPWSKDEDSSRIESSRSGASSSGEQSEFGTLEKRNWVRGNDVITEESDEGGAHKPSSGLVKAEGSVRSSKSEPSNVKKETVHEFPEKANYPYLQRSPSWTEGISSPEARKMKVKDVSQYMIDAAKENPQLAQKLHDVLLESGVVAPANLFTEIYQEQASLMTAMDKSPTHQEKDEENKKRGGGKKKSNKGQGELGHVRFLPPLPYQGGYSSNKGSPSPSPSLQLDNNHSIDLNKSVPPIKYVKNVPVTAAAAAAAAVVASSMVVAASKTIDPNIDLPVAAAAAVVATSAAARTQYDTLETSGRGTSTVQVGFAAMSNALECARSDGDGVVNSGYEPHGGSGEKDQSGSGENIEGERRSDRSAGSTRSESALDDVADCEIPWEDITLGERIGLGSYGEVYRGDWHGTEVAVKKFLDQAITVESLQEFRSEVQIMRRVRHPNVVLFMGAVTRPPNLSIITEFLPRGSLYRLIHRPNNQLDVRRRLRMALDAARGMNYLHNCTPVIVHRDLKSPNLLVDKNWVVKVCDFGLSRMKYGTFLSSRSTAGTAEWMAPEVLRNEPSNEKCDVYSFGVILWELCTMQQPWGGMNPMQVVGAVGFQYRRLEIPDDIDPVVADIIKSCWETDPRLRPSFAEIMAALKPLQKSITNASRG